MHSLFFAQSSNSLWQQLQSPAGLLLLLGMGLACYLMLRNYWVRQQRGERERPVSDIRARFKELQRDSAVSDAPVDVLRWEVEMQKTARDLKAEIDCKILALQAVTKVAQTERLRLEETLRQAAAVKVPLS